ncbi:MAG TPA: HPr family phosphocarrier protein [Spirochaetota bacterium]|nr:HPr family phosphocarrier protein [Spirochaetota bacterium]
MRESKVVVNWRAGLHAKPAVEVVKIANKFKSKVTIRKEDMEVDGKSIFGIMMLSATYKTTLSLIIDGIDEEEATNEMLALFDEIRDE